MKITIQTSADFTPPGKRRARIVQTTGRFGHGRQLRWYVGGRWFRSLTPSAANIALTEDWMQA